VDVRGQYQVKISNRFAALENDDDDEDADTDTVHLLGKKPPSLMTKSVQMCSMSRTI